MPELRQNIITGDWVVIAPGRAKRPSDFKVPEPVKTVDLKNCPFCEGTDLYKTNKRIRGASTETVYTIDNKYPAFVENGNKASARSFYPEGGFYRARPSTGDHDVIVIKDHELDLPFFPKKVMEDMFEVMQMRYIAHKERKDTVSIMPIYNHGSSAGASIDHPHAQIFSSGIVANTINREFDGAKRYFGINGACVFCDLIKHERKEKVRVVYENDDFLAATFFAARFPMETWVYPKEHESQFEKSTKKILASLSDCMLNVLRRMEQNVENIPLNFYIHSLPATLEGADFYHWHLEITPRVQNFGGYELGSGVIIDIMSPEDAAEYLRHPKARKD